MAQGGGGMNELTVTATDWRQIDTSTPEGRRALNIEIAKRLGYTVRLFGVNAPPKYIAVFASDGTRMRGIVGSDATPEQLWERVYAPIDGLDEPTLPDWANDLNAAASLPLPGDRVFMEVRRWDEGFASARVWDFPTLPHHSLFLDGETTALAWCKAWLAWNDAKRKAVQS